MQEMTILTKSIKLLPLYPVFNSLEQAKLRLPATIYCVYGFYKKIKQYVVMSCPYPKVGEAIILKARYRLHDSVCKQGKSITF